MSKYNVENERVKHRYRVWLQDGQGYSENAIDQALAAIHAYEHHTGFRPFRRFRFEQARAFARDMKARTHPKTGRLYSKATLNGMFGALRKFFQWLGGEKDFRREITVADAAYFRLNEKEARIARATRPKQVPDVDDVHRVIAAMPDSNDIEKRDRAVLAFILLTGARVSAVISAKIKHVDLTQGAFFQDAREVKTKRSKTFTTWFFPVGDKAEEVLCAWVTLLVTERGFAADDPLFPATRLAHDEDRHFVPAGLSRQHWLTDQPVRDIVHKAFLAAGLPPPNPHVIRDTLVRLGLSVCSIEQFKAWSQNLGHDKVHTTLASYGTLDDHRQGELIRGIGAPETWGRVPGAGPPSPDVVRQVLDHLREQNY